MVIGFAAAALVMSHHGRTKQINSAGIDDEATMKSLLKTIFSSLQKPIDRVFSILIIPAALMLLKYRRFGSANFPKTTRRLRKIGVFPIMNHYYEPLIDDTQFRQSLSENRHLPGLNLNTSGQLSFLKTLVYSAELLALKLDTKSNDANSFYINNRNFESGDAEYLYQIIRATKPSKLIEVGSGHSTKIASIALQKNRFETSQAVRHICIEPYEMPWLEGFSDIQVVRQRVENCALDWAAELRPGDILFVDSSHVIRPQGDVLEEYLEIFPQLASGVYIHIHDIFTPKDYPRSWIVDQVRFWNEQYLLEALLSNTDRYEVIGALNYLKNNHFDDLQKVCPYLTLKAEPGSFYMRVR
jgi:Methyltransferase domain